MALYSRASAYRSSDFVIIFTVCLAMFTDGFISGIVAPVIPFLLEDKNLVADNKSRKAYDALANLLMVVVQLCTSILLASYSTADFFGARKLLKLPSLAHANRLSSGRLVCRSCKEPSNSLVCRSHLGHNGKLTLRILQPLLHIHHKPNPPRCCVLRPIHRRFGDACRHY